MFNKYIAGRPQPLDETSYANIQVGVLETQEGADNDLMYLTADLESTANTVDVIVGRPYLLKGNVDFHIEVKQYPNGVDIDDATTDSYPIAANEPVVTFLQEGAQVSVIKASGASDGKFFAVPY